MSLVKPHAEVPPQITSYTNKQREVLSIQLGVTDLASLTYVDEDTILAQAEDPEHHYRKAVLTEKMQLGIFSILCGDPYE